ncbi:MAG: IMPACT family member YigZ [Bacteroidetes bacterium ADurb.Bin408]|nr:MAG: IMPACT family member YigZ [Bacteroidetes bacterium ADurb.Bin408]
MFEDTYKTIIAISEGLYKEKGSRFIALAFPVNNEQEVKEALGGLRKTYHDARHHCYAYVIGFDRATSRMNDDGEPSGTAGKPIYNQILASGLTNVLVVVVRYFGGTLLGVSGLLRAYKTAAADALSKAKIIEKTVNDVYGLAFPYIHMNDVMRCLKENNAIFLEQNYDTESFIRFSVRKGFSDKIFEILRKIEGAKITYEKTI